MTMEEVNPRIDGTSHMIRPWTAGMIDLSAAISNPKDLIMWLGGSESRPGSAARLTSSVVTSRVDDRLSFVFRITSDNCLISSRKMFKFYMHLLGLSSAKSDFFVDTPASLALLRCYRVRAAAWRFYPRLCTSYRPPRGIEHPVYFGNSPKRTSTSEVLEALMKRSQRKCGKTAKHIVAEKSK